MPARIKRPQSPTCSPAKKATPKKATQKKSQKKRTRSDSTDRTLSLSRSSSVAAAPVVAGVEATPSRKATEESDNDEYEDVECRDL